MKDVVIKGWKIRRELWILFFCFVAAEGTNLFAILKYSRPAIELLSMIGFVLVFTLVIYLLIWIVRLIVLLFCKIFKIK